jgi:hypothetical protein
VFRALLFIVSAIACFSSLSAFAHHSRAAYDMTKEVTLEGTVAELAWSNPHIFMTVETHGEDGKANRVEVEVTSVSEAASLGLPRWAIAPGARVIVRAHPGRGGATSRAVGLVVTAADGTLYPLNTDARLAVRHVAVPASGLAGRWSPTLESFNGVMAAIRSWPLTEAGQATAAARTREFQSAATATLGICEPFPPPILSIFPDQRTIEINDTTVRLRFEGAVGVNMERVVYMDREHPADVAPSLMGHSIGRWEGETLVIDTIGFTPHHVGVMFFQSGPAKHLVERLTLAPDRLGLEYSFTIEDPEILASPVTYTATWDHRPDLEPSGVACDPETARRPLQD